MTSVAVGVAGLLYLITSISFLLKHQWSWALTYFAYALANVGLILAALETPPKS